MTNLENLYHCPVCLGIHLKKIHFEAQALTLDYCERCGGMWFDNGEVEALKRSHPSGLPQNIPLNESVFIMNCHQCHEHLKRNDPFCSFCHWKNRIDCPLCENTMSQTKREGLTLDVCKTCKGIWFDNHELAYIWNLAYALKPGVTEHNVGFTDFLLASGDVIVDHPLLAVELIEATPLIIEGVAALPEVAGTVFEGASGIGEAAGSIFDVIAEILGGLF